MKPANSVSLKFWLPLLVASACIILWATMTWMEHRDAQSSFIASSLQSVRQDMASLQHEMEKELSTGRHIEAEEALALSGVNTRYRALLATDEKGRILYTTRLALKGLQADVALPEFDPQRTLGVRRNKRIDVRVEPGGQRIKAYFPLALGRDGDALAPPKSGVLFSVYDISSDQAQIWSAVLRSSLSFGALLLCVMLALIGFLQHFVSRPIQHLVAAAAEFAKDESNTRSDIRGHGELARLGLAFNAMAEKLRQRSQQRTQAEEALREQERHSRDLLHSTAEAIYGLDLHGNCTFANPSCVNMLGYQDAAELIGRNMHDLIHYQCSDGAPYPLKNCPIFAASLSGNCNHTDTDVLWRADGSSFPAEYWSYPIQRDGKRTGAVVSFLDITERMLAKEKILKQAHFDPLTELPNRFLSLDRLAQLLKEAKRNADLVAVLFLDLDDFKKINESLGHETGDQLLIEAALRLTNAVRGGDTVGRLGGDEFIIVLRGLSQASQATPVAQQLLNCFRDSFKIDGRQMLLTASIGIAVSPRDGSNCSELLRNADAAMYHAKELGRNAYSYFTNEMNQQVSRRLAVEEQIHSALQRNEFEVYYQVQIDVVSDRIIGAEALLRWHNPTLGNISPLEFIPIAEQTGLILPIGQFVLSNALAIAAQWQQQHDAKLLMAVNISPRQFRDPELVSYIEKALLQADIAADSLELEITEGVLMSGHSYIDEALAALSDLGVGIAMDDFGTGYSSLSYLRKYPFNTLKIDRSFVNDITVEATDRELIIATITMAHGLGLKVVAEGVEAEAQLSFLKQHGCDCAQGYLFGKPESAEKFLSHRHKDFIELTTKKSASC